MYFHWIQPNCQSCWPSLRAPCNYSKLSSHNLSFFLNTNNFLFIQLLVTKDHFWHNNPKFFQKLLTDYKFLYLLSLDNLEDIAPYLAIPFSSLTPDENNNDISVPNNNERVW